MNSYTVLQYSYMEADKGQSQNIYEIRQNVFKIRKNISNRNVFLNHRWRVYQIRKSITNLNKIIESTKILFCTFPKYLQIQELSLNPEKYFANLKKYFVTCYLCRQPATISCLPLPKWRSFVSRVQLVWIRP